MRASYGAPFLGQLRIRLRMAWVRGQVGGRGFRRPVEWTAGRRSGRTAYGIPSCVVGLEPGAMAARRVLVLHPSRSCSAVNELPRAFSTCDTALAFRPPQPRGGRPRAHDYHCERVHKFARSFCHAHDLRGSSHKTGLEPEPTNSCSQELHTSQRCASRRTLPPPA